MASSGGRPRLLGFTFPIRPLDHGFVVFERRPRPPGQLCTLPPLFFLQKTSPKKEHKWKRSFLLVFLFCARKNSKDNLEKIENRLQSPRTSNQTENSEEKSE